MTRMKIIYWIIGITCLFLACTFIGRSWTSHVLAPMNSIQGEKK